MMPYGRQKEAKRLNSAAPYHDGISIILLDNYHEKKYLRDNQAEV